MKLNRSSLRRLIESVIAEQVDLNREKESAFLNAVNKELKDANLFSEEDKIFANPSTMGTSSFGKDGITLRIGPVRIKGDVKNGKASQEKAKEILNHLNSDAARRRMAKHSDVRRMRMQHFFDPDTVDYEDYSFKIFNAGNMLQIFLAINASVEKPGIANSGSSEVDYGRERNREWFDR